MTFVGVDQDHQVVSEPRVFDIGVLAVACDFPRSLQQRVRCEPASQLLDNPLWTSTVTEINGIYVLFNPVLTEG